MSNSKLDCDGERPAIVTRTPGRTYNAATPTKKVPLWQAPGRRRETAMGVQLLPSHRLHACGVPHLLRCHNAN
eukprot:6976999-Pyramimonas_sp.AAC.1